MKEIRIRKPDDMHFHPREGMMLHNVLRYTSSIFIRGVVMGNLPNSILNADDAKRYRQEILSVDPNFDPLMTIMLKKSTTPKTIREARKAGIMFVKYMPEASTTNSDGGIYLFDLLNSYRNVLEEIRNQEMFLLGHWTLPGDIFSLQREMKEEGRAISFLEEIVEALPGLHVTVEHVSTAKMIEFVKISPYNVTATITCHHPTCDIRHLADLQVLKINNPNYYCKPILNEPLDSLAVRMAMMSGNPKFFFGSDSAPHPISAKKKNPPAAGIFSAPVALPILCQAFEMADELDKLEDFVSRFGAQAYNLPLNEGEIILRKDPWIIPEEIEGIGAFYGGRTLDWHVV